MVIHKKIHKVNVYAPKLPEGNYLAGRIGFWGLVKEQNSKTNTVTVISDTGYEFPNVAVKSDEWVTVDDSKNYIPSQRNLPPVNSRVFVLTPTFSAAGAFILCSGFSRGDENIRTLWAKNESELADKNNSREVKTQGGWDKKEEYANGNFSCTSNDGEIKFIVNPVKDTGKSQAKEVSVSAWGNEIKITKDSIQIMAAEGAKVKIGNSVDSVKGILNDILQILNSSLATAGSPANHTVVPGQFTDVITKLNNILE